MLFKMFEKILILRGQYRIICDSGQVKRPEGRYR